MKRILYIFLSILFAFALSVNVFAASVIPTEFPGNDENSYVPPIGCIRTKLPQSNVVGTHVYTFNDFGQLDPDGTNTLTIEIGTVPPATYTQVLSWSWSGSYPLYSVIVKGGPAFNEYVYDGTATSDTNLVSPTVGSGDPADVSHVSVVLCPDELPPVPPDGDTVCCVLIILLLLVILALLIAVLINVLCIKDILCHKKHHGCDNDPNCR